LGGSVVKPVKLYEKLQQSRHQVIAFRDFERLLVAFGFTRERSAGSHFHYSHPDVPWLLTVNPGRDAKRYQVRQFLDIVEEFGLGMDE
jgi:predicted RNA binding protein YcfA (HicA-like mRNA interferase family)